MNVILIISLGIIASFLFIVVYNTFLFKSLQQKVCANEGIEINEKAIDNLSKAVKYRTVSIPEEEKPDYNEFLRFHKHLSRSYPLIHFHLERIKIQKYSLIFRWEGSNPDLKPLVLLAHMDVVPVDHKSESSWHFRPFDGRVDDEFIWGRGTLDNKMSLIAIMESVEYLLSRNFVPERTIYLAFGHDEECYGTHGAKAIADWMRGRGINAGLILDEGLAISSGMIPGFSKDVAMVGVAEKGTAYVELTTNRNPGHLSMPNQETAIHTLSRAILRLQAFKLPIRISEPVEGFFNFLGPELPFFKKMAFANQFLFKRRILRSYKKSNAGNATIRSTITPTLFHGGERTNASTTSCRVVLQIKVLPGEKLEDIIEGVQTVIDDERIMISKVEKMYDENMGVSSYQNKSFGILNKTIKQVFPNIITVPSLCIATTDSRHFHDISDAIYRFSPFHLDPENLKSIHGINERVAITDYKNAINFYIQLIKNMKHSAYQLSFTA